MNIREEREAWERAYLSPYASRSSETRGRDREEQKCDIRPEYQRDRDRILHSKAFRRMKHRFFLPQGVIITEQGLRIHWRYPRLQER